MRYDISKEDGLYCVYKWENIGWRIIAACETLEEAENVVNRSKAR